MSRDWFDEGRPTLLSLEDPNAPDTDIGRNSFNINSVRAAFSHAYRSLMSQDPDTISYLASIFPVDAAFLEYRALIKRIYV